MPPSRSVSVTRSTGAPPSSDSLRMVDIGPRRRCRPEQIRSAHDEEARVDLLRRERLRAARGRQPVDRAVMTICPVKDAGAGGERDPLAVLISGDDRRGGRAAGRADADRARPARVPQAPQLSGSVATFVHVPRHTVGTPLRHEHSPWTSVAFFTHSPFGRRAEPPRASTCASVGVVPVPPSTGEVSVDGDRHARLGDVAHRRVRREIVWLARGVAG